MKDDAIEWEEKMENKGISFSKMATKCRAGSLSRFCWAYVRKLRSLAEAFYQVLHEYI